MKIRVYYKKGAILVLDFKTEQFAIDYLKEQKRNIKAYEVL